MTHHIFAVKYLDANGSVLSSGYIETMDDYKPGDMVHMWNGQPILIDFEV